MRLFGKVDGQINRFDRAAWLSGIFDLPFGLPAGGTGVFAYPLELARTTLAACASFQTWTAEASAAAARLHTHLGAVTDAEPARPLVLAAMGDAFTARAMEEPCVVPDIEGEILLIFEQAVAEGQSEKDAKIDLLNHVGAILEEAEQLAGTGGWLNIVRSAKRIGPSVYDDRDVAAGAPAIVQVQWAWEWQS